MTIRPMRTSSPPDEEWVVIGYRTDDGLDLEYRQEWLVVQTEPEDDTSDSKSLSSKRMPRIGLESYNRPCKKDEAGSICATRRLR